MTLTAPRISIRWSRDVVPTIGAVTPSKRDKNQRGNERYGEKKRTRLVQTPSRRDLRHADTLLLRDLVDSEGTYKVSRCCSGEVNCAYLEVRASKNGIWNILVYISVLPRRVASRVVRVSSPRPNGDQGIEPTPNI